MSSKFPILSGLLLASMFGAGLSHFWSVNQFISFYNERPPAPSVEAPSNTLPQPQIDVSPAEAPLPPSPAPDTLASAQPVPSELQEAILTMYSELKEIKNERDSLVDQLAETNRDVMKMQFQIDTHSESFRPLPTQDRDPLDTTYGVDPYRSGVLPPKDGSMYDFNE